MKLTLFLFCAIFHFTVIAQNYSPVTIANTEQRSIYSKIVNQDYTLHIMKQGDLKAGEKVPVLYLLDSQWDFPLINSIYGEQYFDGYIPKMLIVGITWGKDDNPDVFRRRDYTPTSAYSGGNGGGADKFLSFLDKELFPFIELEYNGDSENRTIAGCSLGGLFTLYALFNREELFDNYISATPAIGWDNDYLFEKEEAYGQNNKGKRKNVFIGHGSEEFGVEKFELFMNKMTSRNYSHLNIKSQLLEGVGHSGTKALAYTWGMQHVNKKDIYNLSLKTMESYTGEYKNERGNTIKIIKDSGSLYLGNGNRRLPLRPTSKNFFVYDGMFLNISIQFDENNTVTSLTEHQYGSDTVYSKL